MPQTIPTDLKRPAISAADLVHPLDDFYAQKGMALPPLEQLDGEAVPQPYRQLLVHRDDMTPTLERFYDSEIHLKMLGRRRQNGDYFREVVLLTEGTDQPVEFGAIKIHLARFSPAAQQAILAELWPLGHIMRESGIRHSSRPQAFLRLASDPFINDALRLTGANVLYGRRNTLFDAEDRSMAEIVEILPPAAPDA
jgi:chorismate-pyruvate lyase